jgi:hypothetical protein
MWKLLQIVFYGAVTNTRYTEGARTDPFPAYNYSDRAWYSGPVFITERTNWALKRQMGAFSAVFASENEIPEAGPKVKKCRKCLSIA